VFFFAFSLCDFASLCDLCAKPVSPSRVSRKDAKSREDAKVIGL
jgi:hypothetical protein